jgi:potassium voltage-gated channel Eag-related subfamily H protein 7
VPIATFFGRHGAARQHPAHLAIDALVDVFFIVDIVLSFRTGFLDEAKTLVMDPHRIRRRYVRSWFALDLVSALPTQLIALAAGAYSSLYAIKLLRLLKIGEVTHFTRSGAVHQWGKAIGLYGRPGLMQLISFLFIYFVVCHLVACAYWAVASSRGERPPCAEWGAGAWGVCDELVDDAPLAQQYASAFYWAVVTLLGNDTGPASAEVATPCLAAPLRWMPRHTLPRRTLASWLQEKNFTSCVIVVGIFVNAVIIGSCASLLLGMDHKAIVRQQQMDAVNMHLAYNKVPAPLAARVRSYFDFLFASGLEKDEAELFGDLPLKMQLQLTMIKKKPLLQATQIFRNLAAECTVAIVNSLQPTVVLAREYVLIQGQGGDQMFFISRGLVQVTHFLGGFEQPLCQLRDGGHFGEMALLNLEGRRTANVLTLKNCELQILARPRFVELQDAFPAFREQARRRAGPPPAVLLFTSRSSPFPPIPTVPLPRR